MLALSYKEIMNALLKVEKEYLALSKTKGVHGKKVATSAFIVIRKIKQEINKKIMDNHGS